MPSTHAAPARFRLAQIVCRRLPPLVSQRVRSWIYPLPLAQRDDYRFDVRALTGGRYRGSTRDLYGWSFGVHGYYEWRLWAVAVALCTPGDGVIELGANVGTETVGFADIVGPSGRVYAFEPLPEHARTLRELAEQNGYGNVQVLPYAVGDHDGVVEFTVPPWENSGLGFVVAGDGGGGTGGGSAGEAGMEKLSVQLRRLDALGDALGPARVIFADIEGSEHAMLRGAEKYLAAHGPALVLEAHQKNVRRYGLTLRDLLAELTRQGYRAFRIGRFGLGAPEPDSEALMNWFCVHRSRPDDARRVQTALLRAGFLPCFPRVNPIVR